MRKVNIEELTRSLNKFRMEHTENLFGYEQIQESFKSLGFSKGISQALTSLMNSKLVGNKKFFQFGKNPIHTSEIEALYNRMASYANKRRERKPQQPTQPTISIDKALEAVQAAGYQIRKIVGFDLETFSKENPEMYKKYLKYEII